MIMVYAQTQKITSPSPSVGGNFATSVVIDGYYALVGEALPGDTHLYKRNADGQWEIQKTFAINGASVALYDNYIVIGNGDDNVKVFHKETHTELKNITGGDGFGSSVAINGSYIVVGAPNTNSNRGAIYIYEKTGTDVWTAYSSNPVTASIQTDDDYFGCSVALNGTSVIVGAYGDNQKTGAVYIFDKDSVTELWGQSQKIIASDGAYNDEFGASISASGGYLVSGAKLKDSSSDDINAGAAYLYKYTTVWYEIDKLEGTNESSYEGNRFGESVYINGDYIIIGSPKARGIGVADIFYKKRSWGHLKKVLGGDSVTDDDYGQSVSISGRFAMVGSISEDEAASNAGAAYFYEDPPVRVRLAQEFDVYNEYVPSKATIYLKRMGKNSNNYWPIYSDVPIVIDATNFSTVVPIETTISGSDVINVVMFSDELEGFTGNGYMILMDDSGSIFPVISYPIRAITPVTLDLWIRCLSSISDVFRADIMLDGVVFKTMDEEISNPSVVEWSWVHTEVVVPDNTEHVLGIRIKDRETAIDKLYIGVDSSTPYSEGSDYSAAPYLTAHMQLYDSNGSPHNLLYVYDYKNSITEITQDDWYNFDIRVLDAAHGYTDKKHFDGAYFMVLSCSGSSPENFILWELVDNDEYRMSPSAIKF